MSVRRIYEIRTKLSKQDGSWCGQAQALVNARTEVISEVWADSLTEAIECLAEEVRDWLEGAEVVE